ncbi:hypothetical protein IF1G_05554 [Cordyceps javanica]|uniref:Uncharacterized protein n=1 Tax=Cordyceps javanica TaxID=43265 RepID=A0A545V1X5_9HYPO|nr:hypothetical protein IF1G_05554 [Cordyceps javanica]
MVLTPYSAGDSDDSEDQRKQASRQAWVPPATLVAGTGHASKSGTEVTGQLLNGCGTVALCKVGQRGTEDGTEG